MACRHCLIFLKLEGQPLPLNSEDIATLIGILDKFKTPHHNWRTRLLLELGWIMVKKNEREKSQLKNLIEVFRLVNKIPLRNFLKNIPLFENNQL